MLCAISTSARGDGSEQPLAHQIPVSHRVLLPRNKYVLHAEPVAHMLLEFLACLNPRLRKQQPKVTGSTIAVHILRDDHRILLRIGLTEKLFLACSTLCSPELDTTHSNDKVHLVTMTLMAQTAHCIVRS